MDELRKAAQQALEALETASRNGSDGLKRYELKELDDTIANLRTALVRPESEPESVLHKWAALFEDPNNDWQAGYEHARRWVLEVGLQSIATPPQRKPLQDEEIDELSRTMVKGDKSVNWLCRAIEKAHGIGEWWPVFQRAATDSEGGEV